MGNYKDALMEQLADKGNGNNFYIDSLAAAKKVFHDQLGANLEVVARDVKLQVDFDPAQVARYRLVGYENRTIADDDFRKDPVCRQRGDRHHRPGRQCLGRGRYHQARGGDHRGSRPACHAARGRDGCAPTPPAAEQRTAVTGRARARCVR
jgi:hypothetical protein